MSAPEHAASLTSAIPIDDVDRNDTYYTADVVQEGRTVIRSNTPITDPVTGQQTYEVVFTHPRETLRIDVGYDFRGRIRETVQQLDPVGDPLTEPVNTTRRTHSMGYALTRHDAAGMPVAEEYMADEAPVPSLYEDLGALEDIQITDGVLMDASLIDSAPALSTAKPVLDAAGPVARTERIGSDRIRIVNDIGAASGIGAAAFRMSPAAPGAPSGHYARTFRRVGSHYRLEEVETFVRQSMNGVTMENRQVDRITNLAYGVNSARTGSGWSAVSWAPRSPWAARTGSRRSGPIPA